MVMSGSRRMIGSVTPIFRIIRHGLVLMVAGLEDNLAERQMAVIARYAKLVLDTIDHARCAGARKGEHQRGAKHRAKPEKRKSRKPHHTVEHRSPTEEGKHHAEIRAGAAVIRRISTAHRRKSK